MIIIESDKIVDEKEGIKYIYNQEAISLFLSIKIKETLQEINLLKNLLEYFLEKGKDFSFEKSVIENVERGILEASDKLKDYYLRLQEK